MFFKRIQKILLVCQFQNGPLCPGGLNIPMYSLKSGFRLGETLDFVVESESEFDPVLGKGEEVFSRALRTIDGISGTLNAKDA